MPIVYRLGLLMFVVSFFVASAGFAQQAPYLPYHSQDTSKIYSLAHLHRVSMKKAFALPDGISKGYKKDFLALTEGFSDNIYNTIRYGALLDTLIDPYVQGVFQRVMAGSKDLPAAQIIVIRSPIENAYAVGDGTILLNVGLLSKLENESQLAFVICHELAHIYFNHMQKGVKEHFDTFYNKEFQKKYKKIVKEEYNLYAKVNDLVQNASLSKLYHKRSHEQQADSLGYVFLARAGFNASQAYTALQLLDHIEAPYSSEEVDFTHHFGCMDAYHLFERKAEKSTSIFAVESEEPKAFELSDTLKTHPDCEKRMEYIQALAQHHPQETAQGRLPVDQKRFNYISSISRIEVIQSWYDAGFYDHAFFEALLLLQEEPDNSYLHSIAMLCLFEFKDHLRKHLYADVVSRVSDHYPANFNELLEKLHSLNLSDFKHLGSCFNELNPSKVESGEYSLAAAYAYQSLLDEQMAAAEIKEKYLRKYQQGRLKNSLFN